MVRLFVSPNPGPQLGPWNATLRQLIIDNTPPSPGSHWQPRSWVFHLPLLPHGLATRRTTWSCVVCFRAQLGRRQEEIPTLVSVEARRATDRGFVWNMAHEAIATTAAGAPVVCVKGSSSCPSGSRRWGQTATPLQAHHETGGAKPQR